MSVPSIGIKEIDFVINVTSLNTAANSLSKASGKVASYTSVSNTLDKYDETYSDISKVLERYKSLISRDAGKLNNAGSSIITMDRSISNNFMR